jgi:hypothetical protein
LTDKARHLFAGSRSAPAGAGILILALLVVAPNVLNPGDVGANADVNLTNRREFAIKGNAPTPLSPGRMVPLDLRFVNDHPRRLLVGRLAVTLRLIHAPHADRSHPCTQGDFAVQQAPRTLEVTVPARSGRHLSGLGVLPARWPHVGMLNRPVNQDGCKGATVALTYHAAGRLIT